MTHALGGGGGGGGEGGVGLRVATQRAQRAGLKQAAHAGGAPETPAERSVRGRCTAAAVAARTAGTHTQAPLLPAHARSQAHRKTPALMSAASCACARLRAASAAAAASFAAAAAAALVSERLGAMDARARTPPKFGGDGGGACRSRW